MNEQCNTIVSDNNKGMESVLTNQPSQARPSAVPLTGRAGKGGGPKGGWRCGRGRQEGGGRMIYQGGETQGGMEGDLMRGLGRRSRADVKGKKEEGLSI